MIREICRNEAFLAQKVGPATADDLDVAQDLLNTLAAHRNGWVGIAANMIGIRRIIRILLPPICVRSTVLPPSKNKKSTIQIL